MKTIAAAALALALTACASGPSPRSPVAKPVAKPAPIALERVDHQVDLSALDSNQVMQLLRRGSAKAEVKVCVAPNGQVSRAELVASSGEEWLDAALIASLKDWSYRTYQPTSTAQRCEQFRVDFRG